MFIAKSRIEDFDDCRVGDVLYEDPDDKSYDWKLYTDQNRITAKLKSRPILPGALVAKVEEKGLNVQTISVYQDDAKSYTTMSVSSAVGSFSPQSYGYNSSPIYTGRKTGGKSAKVKPTPPKSKVASTPITTGKFIGKSIGKLIRKIR